MSLGNYLKGMFGLFSQRFTDGSYSGELGEYLGDDVFLTTHSFLRDIHSRNRKPGIVPNLRRSESQNDLVPRNAGIEQIASDTVFRAIALNPNLAVNQIQMNKAAVNVRLFPSRPTSIIM